MKRPLSHHLSVVLRTLLVCHTLVKSSRAECNDPACAGFKVSTIATDSIVLSPPDPTDDFWQNCTLSINDTTYAPTNITGLEPGAIHEVTYTRYNCCQAFTTKPKAVRNLDVTEVTAYSVSLNWTRPEGQSSSYEVQWNDGTNRTSVSHVNVNIGGLRPGVQYTFSVTALANDNETRGASTNKTVYTKPEVIRNLNVSEITTSSVYVSWSEPEGKRSFFTIQYTNVTNGNVSGTHTVSETSFNVTGLTPGERYTFSVFAVAGDNETFGKTVETSLCTQPEVIRNLNVSEITTSSVYVSWSEPEGKRSFFTIQYTNVTNGNVSGTHTVSETSFNVTGLTPGERYTFSVVAVAGDNETFGKTVETSLCTQPEVVRNLKFTEITTSTVFVSWSEPVGISVSYRVEWTNGSVSERTETDQTHVNITDLTPGGQYTFSVKTLTCNQTEGNGVSESFYAKPEVIRNLNVSEITTSSVYVSWSEPEGKRSFFTIQYTNGNVSGTHTVSETSFNVTGLTPGERYTFSVVAVAGDNETFGKTVETSLCTQPEVVRNLKFTEITTSTVFVSWSEPVGISVSYRVEWTNGSVSERTETDQTHVNITDLTPGGQYTFSVKTLTCNQTEGNGVSESFYAKPEVIRNLNVSEITTSSVYVSWSEPEGKRSFFTIQYTNGNNSETHTVSKTSFNVTGLTPGERYTFSVVAVAGDNETFGKTVETSLCTQPEVVRNLKFTEITTSTVFVSWTEPVGISVSYRVEWTNGSVSERNATDQTHVNITDLTPGGQYTFSVKTLTCNQTEGNSVSESFYTKPEAIRNLKAAGITTSSVFLNWTEPVGMTSSYRVEWTDESEHRNETVYETYIDVVELMPGARYKFTVFAVAADQKTDSEKDEVSLFTYPEMIRNFTLCNITTSSVSLKWSVPNGESSFYAVEWNDGNALYKNKSTNQTVFRVDSLTAGEMYYFAVAAVAGDNISKGVAFNSSHATKPNTIARPSVHTTNSSISLTWTRPAGVVSMYRVEWDNGGTQLNMTTYSTSALLADLAAGTTYTIKVIAIATDNQTEGEPFILSVVTKPGMISGLLITEVTSSSVSVRWTAPQGNVSSYTVRWSGTVGAGGNNSASGTSHNITGLSPGVLYNVTVAAVAGNITNEGARAFISTFTRPEKPFNITVAARATDSLNLSWSPPSGHVQRYHVTVRNGDLNFWANMTSVEPMAHLSSLKPGRVYEVNVTAVAGPFTETSDQTSLATVPTAPGGITRRPPEVTQRTTTALHLEWSSPHGMEGAPHTSYNVSYQAATGGAAAQNQISTSNHTVLSSLSSGTRFDIVVHTVGPQGFTSVLTPTTSAYTLPNPVQELTASPESTTSVKVQWSHPEGHQSYFTYRIQTSNPNISELVNVSTNSIVVTGLDPGTGYTFSVTTEAEPGSHSTAEQASSYTMPKAVSGLSAEGVNTTAIKLTWDRQDDFKANYSYLVTVGDNNGDSVSVHTETHTFAGLTAGQQYTFTVSTVVQGVRSTPRSLTSHTKPAAVPDIKAIGTTTSMSVSWGVAGGRVDSYSVLLHRGDELAGNHSGLSNNTRRVLFEGLIPGTLYTVTVATASGPLSQNSTAVNATFPNPPGPIVVESQTTACINISWARPHDMEPDQYNFTVFHWDRSTQTSNNWTLLDNLLSGTAYDISVVTVGVLGYLSTVETTRNYTKPHSVSMLKEAGISPTEVMLVWDQPESRPGYSYTVLVTISENGSWVASDIVSTPGYNASGLQSGTNYTFTVTTQTVDGTQASPEAVSYFTRPYGVSSLEAETWNSTTIQLTWNSPPQSQSAYTYRVETAPSGSMSTTNSTVPREQAQVSGLTPGTNHSFCVFVRAQDGTEGTPSCMSQYTKPEAVQPTVSNEGSNSSMRVRWTAPAGNVERYVVHLNDSSDTFDGGELNTTLFSSLSAGQEYTARVTTHSGPFNATSGFITSATFPNPPGSMDTWTTTGTIQASWGEAPLMTNASFHYVVSRYKQSVPSAQEGKVNVSTSTNTTHTFHSLASGTPYDICVATVGPMGFTSEEVCSPGVTTNPENVTSLAAYPKEESISLHWEKPAGYQESYQYYVSWADSSGHVNNITTREEKSTVQQLIPGSSYHFNVTTETENGIQAATVSVSSCTNSSPVSKLQCQNPNNGTEARLMLEWTKPKGLYSGFTVDTVERDGGNGKNTDNVSMCDGVCRHTVPQLKYHTQYDLTVVTLSCGQPSTPTQTTCTTGITAPPVPSEQILQSLVKEDSKKHNQFSIRIDPDLFNSSGGPIKHYGVLVTNQLGDVDTANLKQYLVKTYEDWSKESDPSPMYLATAGDLAVQGRSGEGLSVTVQIGDTSHWKSYSNGALSSGDEYRYAIVLFTDLKIGSDGLVDIENSFVSITGIHPVPVDLPVNMVLIGIGVGAALGVFVVLFTITIVSVLYWKRLSRKDSPDIQIHSMRNKVSLAVRVEDYEAYYRKQKADSSCGFAEEFEDLKPVGTAQARTSALALENKPKNRYNNVLPYDASRVKLSVHGSPFDDYINANYIPGYNSRKEFIAAQGPLPCTVTEFWRMIWEKNVQTLVMLTRCNEQGRVKCEEYWPAQMKQFGNITVTTTSEIPLEDWTIREFNIKNVRTAESRSVRHFHFTAWPDHGVPETAELLINFRHLVREHMDQYSRHSPTMVHCSAGVGRTGTFIAIDRLIFQIERDGIVDVYGIIHDLRMHRTLMVQTEDQYVFLNQCAMDIIRSRTGTNVDLIYQNTAALTIYENFEPRRS